jgi:putative membrane protein
MNRIISRVMMISGAVVVSGAVAMAQQNPAPMQRNTPANNPTANQNMNNAQQAQMQQEQNGAMHSMQDKAFVRKAEEGNMAEVKLGKLAQEKSNSEDIKQFGAKMVEDHTQLSNQMKPIAQEMGVTSPSELSKKDQQTVSKLENLSGAAFDKAYIKNMMKDHKKDLSEFRDTAQRTQNSQLKQAAQQGAQVIDQHLQMIDQIAKNHNMKGGHMAQGS